MTSYYQCVSCAKTSEQQHCVIKTDGNLICPHCLDEVEFAFGVDTLGEPEPSLGCCDGCDELEAEIHMIDGDWLCCDCKLQVIKAKTDKLKAQTMEIASREPDTKLLREELHDLKKDCADHWEMIKARVFITLFLVWVCFAVWSKYVS